MRSKLILVGTGDSLRAHFRNIRTDIGGTSYFSERRKDFQLVGKAELQWDLKKR
jgi:hypothetical protein